MPADLPSVRPREMVRALERAGFEVHRQRGSHCFMVNHETGRRTTVPIHSCEMRPSLVLAILAQAGVPRDDFLRLLRR